MINDRLVWYLENNKILTDIQCGFRKRKSTLDHLVRLESFIRDAFLNKQEVVSIFFDLEKAYDTTWKYGILKDLHVAGLRGRMPIFITKFLENRNFASVLHFLMFLIRKWECLRAAFYQSLFSVLRLIVWLRC